MFVASVHMGFLERERESIYSYMFGVSTYTWTLDKSCIFLAEESHIIGLETVAVQGLLTCPAPSN